MRLIAGIEVAGSSVFDLEAVDNIHALEVSVGHIIVHEYQAVLTLEGRVTDEIVEPEEK